MQDINIQQRPADRERNNWNSCWGKPSRSVDVDLDLRVCVFFISEKEKLLSRSLERIRRLNDQVGLLEKKARINDDFSQATSDDSAKKTAIARKQRPEKQLASVPDLPWEIAPPPRERIREGRPERKKSRVTVLVRDVILLVLSIH